MKSFIFTLLSLCCATMLLSGVDAGAQTKSKKKAKHPQVDWSVSCVECHNEFQPEKVAVWREGKHGQVNVGCTVCHGDGEVEFHPKPNTERCVGCHSRQEVNFAKHPVKSCFACHAGHSLKFHN